MPKILRSPIALVSLLLAAFALFGCSNGSSAAENQNGGSGGGGGVTDGGGGVTDDIGGGIGTGLGAAGDMDGSVASGGQVLPPPAANNRAIFNFDYGWKFIRGDQTGAEQPAYDDSTWADVSLPHTTNDTDTWVDWVGFANEQSLRLKYVGIMWYRKHFQLDAANTDRKVFLEFQGVRNFGAFYVNGTKIGIHEDQITALGLDITAAVSFGADNVIAVQVDSNMLRPETATGVTFEWSSQGYYPLYGGLTQDANLIITDKLHQTLPLYSNLGTSGVYAYATNIDTAAKSATITVEAEVQNETAASQTATLSVDLIDFTGKTVWTEAAAPQTIAVGQKVTMTATGPLTNAHLWAPDYPYLYDVRSSLKAGDKLVDVVDTQLGIRKLSFSATSGLKVNGRPIYLKGFAPRSVMDWAVTGTPQNWMTEYDYFLMKQGNALFVRPMHVSPHKHMVESADRLGMVMVVPAGNSEGDDTAPFCGTPTACATRWAQRVAVMTTSTIYFRNNPSVFFYEGSNSALSEAHMAEMVAVRKRWDPNGGRFSGTRWVDPVTIPSQEYGSSMDVASPSNVIPSWDSEYSRVESPRRVWDNYTPTWDPHTQQYVTGGYVAVVSPFHAQASDTEGPTTAGNGIKQYPLCDYRQMSSESLALCNLWNYWERYQKSAFVLPKAARLSDGVMVGGCKIFFADSDSDGRMRDTEVARISGAVDGVRIPKESYFAMQVAMSPVPAVHVIGHWNYPANTTKTVYVAANTDAVRLATYDANGALVKDYGQGSRDMQKNAPSQYVFRFDNVAFAPGKIKAVGSNAGADVASYEKATAAPAAALKLTPVTGPKGFFADGADIAWFDVEVVDAAGQRVPTDMAQVAFTHSGEGQWLGGYNSGVRQSIGKDTLWTEGGINRVFVRSTRTAGTFTVTATRDGLTPATATVTSKAWAVDANGLTQTWSQRYSFPFGAEPAAVPDKN
jgi:beta-galactosidase